MAWRVSSWSSATSGRILRVSSTRGYLTELVQASGAGLRVVLVVVLRNVVVTTEPNEEDMQDQRPGSQSRGTDQGRLEAGKLAQRRRKPGGCVIEQQQFGRAPLAQPILVGPGEVGRAAR